jgi:hypothetical protein
MQKIMGIDMEYQGGNKMEKKYVYKLDDSELHPYKPIPRNDKKKDSSVKKTKKPKRNK